MNLIGTIVVYAGLLVLLVGGLSVLRPLTFLHIWSRLQGLILIVVGVGVFLVGANLPAREQRVETPVTRLDEFVPAYQFEEFHSIRIQAPRERVYAAIREVTPDEIRLFRTLTWIRRFGRPGPESILNAPAGEPVLDVALRTSFLKLEEEPDREIVLGTMVAAPKGTQLKKEPTPEDFKALTAPHQSAVNSQQLQPKQQPNTEATEVGAQSTQRSEEPQARAVDSQQAEPEKKPNTEIAEEGAQSPQRSGFALAAINFRLEDAGSGETLLTTETRVYATDASVRKKFGVYWRVIYPGSALIRVMWLRAIRERAERTAP